MSHHAPWWFVKREITEPLIVHRAFSRSVGWSLGSGIHLTFPSGNT